MSAESFWFFSMLVPVVGILVCGAALIVWIVMSQRSKRQAIAAGLVGAAPAPGGAALRVGVFCCGLGVALLLVGLLNLDADSPYTWALIFLGCGGG